MRTADEALRKCRTGDPAWAADLLTELDSMSPAGGVLWAILCVLDFASDDDPKDATGCVELMRELLSQWQLNQQPADLMQRSKRIWNDSPDLVHRLVSQCYLAVAYQLRGEQSNYRSTVLSILNSLREDPVLAAAGMHIPIGFYEDLVGRLRSEPRTNDARSTPVVFASFSVGRNMSVAVARRRDLSCFFDRMQARMLLAYFKGAYVDSMTPVQVSITLTELTFAKSNGIHSARARIVASYRSDRGETQSAHVHTVDEFSDPRRAQNIEDSLRALKLVKDVASLSPVGVLSHLVASANENPSLEVSQIAEIPVEDAMPRMCGQAVRTALTRATAWLQRKTNVRAADLDRWKLLDRLAHGSAILSAIVAAGYGEYISTPPPWYLLPAIPAWGTAFCGVKLLAASVMDESFFVRRPAGIQAAQAAGGVNASDVRSRLWKYVLGFGLALMIVFQFLGPAASG